jgi:hypothetical protein
VSATTTEQAVEQTVVPPLDWHRALYHLQADGQVPDRLQKHLSKVTSALVVYANGNGRNCHPGRDRLSRELHMSERDLKAVFDWLLANGLLRLDKPAARRIGHAAVYSLTMVVPRLPETEFMDTNFRFMDTALGGIAPAFEAPASKGTSCDDVPGPACGGQAGQLAMRANDGKASWHEHGLHEGLLESLNYDIVVLLEAELGEDEDSATWREDDVIQIVLGDLLDMDPATINLDAARKALVQAMDTDCEAHPSLYTDGADHVAHQSDPFKRSQCRCPLNGAAMWRALVDYWHEGPGRSQLDRGKVVNPAGLALSPAALASAIGYWRDGSGWRKVTPGHRFRAGQMFRSADRLVLELLVQDGDWWSWECLAEPWSEGFWERGSVYKWETDRLREMFAGDDTWRYLH